MHTDADSLDLVILLVLWNISVSKYRSWQWRLLLTCVNVCFGRRSFIWKNQVKSFSAEADPSVNHVTSLNYTIFCLEWVFLNVYFRGGSVQLVIDLRADATENGSRVRLRSLFCKMSGHEHVLKNIVCLSSSDSKKREYVLPSNESGIEWYSFNVTHQ